MVMKAGLIGCGRMGAFTRDDVRRFTPSFWFPLAHAEAIAAVPGIALTALCDANLEALQRAEKVYSEAKSFQDAHAMFEETKPDLVSIATRTPGRTELMEAAVDAAVRALHVEKPLCNTVLELERLEKLLAKPDLFVTMGAVRRHLPVFQEAVALAHSGELGALVEIRINMWSGTLYWAHPHSIDLALFAAGERRVESVQARLGALQHPANSPDVIENDPVLHAATIWFDDGLAAHIGRAPGSDFVLSCEQGTITLQNNGDSVIVAQRVGESPNFEYHQSSPTETSELGGTAIPIMQLLDCLNDHPAAQVSNAKLKCDILTGQRILFAIVDSHQRGGCPVPLGEVNRRLEIMGKTGALPA